MSGADFDSLREEIKAELGACLDRISGAELAQAAALIQAAPRIFVSGIGRSGLCMRALAMRLMQLGKAVFVIGETTTPSITTGDLLIVGSGTGETATLVTVTQKAQQQRAKIILLSSQSRSSLARLADHVVLIPAPLGGQSADTGTIATTQPLGSLFEQCLLIVGDALVLALMKEMQVTGAQMARRHANLQ